MSLLSCSTRAVLAFAFAASTCGTSSAASGSPGSVEVNLQILPIQNRDFTLHVMIDAGGSYDLPPYVIDPANVDVEVRRVDVPDDSFHRLVPNSGSPIASGRETNSENDPLDSDAALFFKPYAAVPGATYEVIASARGAISFPEGRAPIDDAGLVVPTYVFVRTSDPANADPELVKLQAVFAAHRAIPARPLLATCEGSADKFYLVSAGIAQNIVEIAENLSVATTGVGPTDDHAPGAAADRSQGRYESLAPIKVTFVPVSPQPACDTASAAFASPREVSAYFAPDATPAGTAVGLRFEPQGEKLHAGDGPPAVGLGLDVKEPVGSSPFTARPALVHLDVRKIGAKTAPFRLTAVSDAVVKSKKDGFPDGTFDAVSISMKPFPVAFGSVYAIQGDARGAFSPSGPFMSVPLRFDTRYLATPAVPVEFGGDRYDPEVRRVLSVYGGKPAVVRAPFGAYCTTGDANGTLARGTIVKITDQDRFFRAFVTGTGPAGDHTATVPPMPAGGSYIALEPIEIAFSLADPGTGCKAYIGMFSSFRDIARYLAPSPVR